MIFKRPSFQKKFHKNSNFIPMGIEKNNLGKIREKLLNLRTVLEIEKHLVTLLVIFVKLKEKTIDKKRSIEH